MDASVPRFEQVFASLREKVFALCLHLTGNRHDAEDALQETFLAVHRALPSFRGEAQVSTWVFRIALRTALHLRTRRREEPTPVDTELAGADVERALEARAEARRLARSFATLAPEQQVVLSLFAVDGLGHREIADVLGIPEGTVWSRLHVARKRLQAALATP